MHRWTSHILVAAFGAFATVAGVRAADSAGQEHAELAKALPAAKVSLEGGLSAASSVGKPISAKFEVEDGKLQLSVYTEKDGKFSEVVVDHVSGKVAESEAITGSEDLSAAKQQSEAMTKAKVSLAAAVAKAVAANTGYRAVSVFAALKDGHPVAEVSLHKGADWRTASEKLD